MPEGNNMAQRYIAEYIRPGIGPVVGTSGVLYGRYASDTNALRYLARMLGKLDHMPAGQYKVSTWPESWSTLKEREVGTIYKTA